MTSLDLGWCRTAAQHGCDVADYLDRWSMVIGPNSDGDLALAALEGHKRHLGVREIVGRSSRMHSYAVG
jgi:hypothetical protein